VGYGIFFGVLILIALNNLFYFFAIRDPGYLAYILFVIANLIFQASLSGHVFQYFLTDLAGWQNRWIAVFTTSGILLGVIFALIFLDIKRYSALTYRFTMGLLVFQMGMLLLSVFMDYASVMPVIKALSMISVLILVILAVRVWQRGNKAARFYVIAYVFYLTFASAFILKTSNLLPETFITVHGFEIAILMECITLSIALADKTRLERDRSNAEKKEAQQEALRIQQEANTTLEQKVQQRTSELNLTVEELHQTLHLANRRKAEIEDKNKDITASLNYAKRIQEASLTSEAQRQLLLPDSFVIFKPRDIVGGDFYCMEQVDGVKVLIVADCTGHGVPGGFMSMLGINLFREMVVARRLTDPAAILEAMNEGIGKALRQQESQNRDGMDAAICTIDESARQLHFSGARIPIYLLQEGHELQTLRPDRFSLGGSGRSEKQIFHTSTLPLVPGLTQFLICTDGLQDQFGGVSGRKFLAKQIRELYSTCRMLPVQAQRQRFEQTLADWMGSHRQIDDILIVGGMIASR
jgi:serine phosphatase RsbU (regulator of sigma subunit)